MSINPAAKLEDLLLSKGIINQSQFDELNKDHIKTGVAFKDLIIKGELASEEDIIKVQAEILAIPYINLDDKVERISKDVISLIPENLARKHVIFPFDAKENKVSVAMSDPEDLDLIQFLERSTKKSIDVYVATSAGILRAIEREYSRDGPGKDVSEAIELAAANTTQKLKEALNNIDQADEIIKVSPVAQIVSVILEYAVKSGASDIHIEPFEDKTRVRYRIDGVLTDKFPLPATIHNSVVARIKILANMPIDEKRKPLDGKFKIEFGDRRTDLRVSTIPTVFGEKTVIRLLKSDQETLSLDQLGLWGKALTDYQRTLKQTTGIILVTGPTGSGKTVTLATSLDMLNSVKVNIITLEDPVEIGIPGVNQVQINPQAGLTFAAGLRSILRQDPNIIMVGEIRDIETARLAIQAALTGHLVLATLHTNSAVASIPRLIDMGMESFLLASTINLALAQRLARKLCNNCKEAYKPDAKILEDMKTVLGDRLFKVGQGPSLLHEEMRKSADDEIKPAQTKVVAKSADEIVLYRAKGCDKCNQTGYKGRIGLFEVVKIESELKKLTENNSSLEDLQKQALANGMINLTQDGYIKAMWGITTIEEILSVSDE